MKRYSSSFSEFILSFQGKKTIYNWTIRLAFQAFPCALWALESLLCRRIVVEGIISLRICFQQTGWSIVLFVLLLSYKITSHVLIRQLLNVLWLISILAGGCHLHPHSLDAQHQAQRKKDSLCTAFTRCWLETYYWTWWQYWERKHVCFFSDLCIPLLLVLSHSLIFFIHMSIIWIYAMSRVCLSSWPVLGSKNLHIGHTCKFFLTKFVDTCHTYGHYWLLQCFTTFTDFNFAWGSQGQQNIFGFIFSHTFHFIRLKFDVVMNQFKLKILRLLLSKI